MPGWIHVQEVSHGLRSRRASFKRKSAARAIQNWAADVGGFSRQFSTSWAISLSLRNGIGGVALVSDGMISF